MTAVGAVMHGWLKGRLERREISEITAEKYGYHMRGFCNYVGPTLPIDQVTTEDIEAWLASARSKDGGQARPRTFNTKITPLRAFFKWAVKRGVIDEDPCEDIARARDGHLIPRRLSQETCTRLLHVADFRQTTLIMLGLHLGLRACEMSRADVEHWDRHGGTLLIKGKGGRERVLPVDGEISSALDMWVDWLAARRGPLFPAHDGRRISAQWVGQLVTKAAEQARVKATTHQLRHTCASDLVARGVPLPVVQQVLGHTSLATTTIYVVPTASEIREHIVGREYRRGLQAA